jgi:TolA-binding protein
MNKQNQGFCSLNGRMFRAGISTALIGASLLSGSARAATAPAPEAKDKKADILKMKVPGDIQTDKQGPSKSRAPIGADEVSRDAQAEQKRDLLIEEVKRILPRIESSPDRAAQLHFEMAEAYWEKSRYAALQEVKVYDDTYGKWLQGVEKNGAKNSPPEPKMATTKSDEFRNDSLVQYRVILEKYPSYERTDEVLFVVAYNLYESGKKDAALANYNLLIKRYPQSKFVPDAYLQLGDHYFNGNDLARARAAYERAVSYRLPKIYAFALYKLAWCDYNAADFQGAIDKFKAVIDYADAQAAQSVGKRDRIEKRSEALRDMVLAYAQIDAIDSAIAYFKDKAKGGSLDYVNKLAGTFFESGKFDQAIRVYKQIEAENPTNVRAPAWQQKILIAYDKLNKRDKVVLEMQVLVDKFGPKSDWAKANADQKGALQEANDLAETAMRELVQDYHQEATKTKSVATYKLARDIYKKYLDTFADNEAAYSMRFYYAEILYALEQWPDAAEQYEQVLALDPKGQYAQRAAYDDILALEKQVAIEKGLGSKTALTDNSRIDDKKAKGQVEQKRSIREEKITKETAEEPIPPTEQKLIAACDRYLDVSPKSKDEISIRYKIAFTYYDHRHYVDAAKMFGDIILRWPNDQWSQKAAELSMNILEVKEQWQPLFELAQKFRQDKRIAPPNSEFDKKLARIAEGARFKYIMDIYDNQKNYELAAKEFKDFVAAYPKSDHATIALNNGILIAEKAQQLDLVIATAEQLIKGYPTADESIMKPAMRSLAVAYERSARYPEAIQAYVAYADKYKQDPASADMIFNAALWKEGLGDDPGAIALWQRYIKDYPQRPDVPKIAFNIGLIYQRKQEWKKVAETWALYQRDYAKTAQPGQLFLARYNESQAMHELRKEDPNVTFIYGELLRRFNALPESERAGGPVIDAAAHARFALLEPQFNEYMALHFNYTKQSDIIYVLKIKNAKMSRLTDAYTDVIKYQSPLYSEAALTRLGEAYANFNHKLLEAPMPKGLTPDQEDLYRTTLENQALPLEDKAVDAYEHAIALSSKTGVYSDWTLRSQDDLKSYKPDAYGDLKKPAPVGAEALATVSAQGQQMKTQAPAETPAPAKAPSATPSVQGKQSGSGGDAQ